MDKDLIINRAQQKLADIVYSAWQERDRCGCMSEGQYIQMGVLNNLIDALLMDNGFLSFDQWQKASNLINSIGGYSELPYKDLDLAFLNTSIIYVTGGSGSSDWGSITNKPSNFPTTIPLVSGLSDVLNDYGDRIEALENQPDISGDFIYENASPTEYQWGNIPPNAVLGGLYISQIIDLATQGVIAPQVISYSATPPTLGFTDSASDTTTVSWTVRRRTSPITSIIITDALGTEYPQAINPTQNAADGGQWSGSQVVSLSENVNNIIGITVLTADSTSNTATASVTVLYRHQRFWFSIDDDILSMTDTEISAILNGLPSGNKEFATSRDMPVRSFTGTPIDPKFVYTAYLSTYGDATFIVNAAANNAWTKREFNYLNPNGFTAAFKLWQFNDQITGTVNVDQN